PKRQVFLKKHTNGKQDTFCETRWTKRASALSGMKENLPGLADALLELSELPGTQKDVDAGCYLKGIEDFSFIVVLCMLEKSFGVLLTLCLVLQEQEIDIVEAMDSTRRTRASLKEMETSEDDWKAIFTDAKNLARDLGVDVKVPRRRGRERVYEEVIGEAAVSEWWREKVWVVYIQHLRQELKHRLLPNEINIDRLKLQAWVEHNPRHDEAAALAAAMARRRQAIFGQYRGANNDLGDVGDAVLDDELGRWVAHWASICSTLGRDELPKSVKDCLNSPRVHMALYPNIKKVLLVLGILPSHTAEAERVISLLRRLKPWLRNTMSQEKLNACALAMAYRDEVEVDIEEILCRWSLQKNRNIALIFSEEYLNQLE
ncbi:unnamed protein product, partial [Heterosigma akashiwo]